MVNFAKGTQAIGTQPVEKALHRVGGVAQKIGDRPGCQTRRYRQQDESDLAFPEPLALPDNEGSQRLGP